MKTSDIPDLPILEYLANRQGDWVSLWYGHFKAVDPLTSDIYYAMPKDTPNKLALSKMKSLLKRGLVSGCACGCRGDFEITRKGLAVLNQLRESK